MDNPCYNVYNGKEDGTMRYRKSRVIKVRIHMETIDEIELIKQAQNGNEEAFTALYERYYARAFAIAYRQTKDHSDAQDVVQDAFIQVHKSIHTLRDPKVFYRWLMQIVHSKCIDLFYKNRNRDSVDPSTMERYYPYEEKRMYMLPEEQSTYEGEQNVLYNIIQEMDEKYSTIIELIYFRQLKLEEIAEYLQIPVGTVKTRSRRAKQELRLRIEAFEKQEGRKLHFQVDALFPSVTFLSFTGLWKSWKRECTSFLSGGAVNVACVVSVTVLSISGGAMAIGDYQAAHQTTPIQMQPAKEVMKNDINAKEAIELPKEQVLEQKAFGPYHVEEREITSTKDAYYLCINWALTKEDMMTKTYADVQEILPIYEELKQQNDAYYKLLQKRGWEEQFLNSIKKM